MNEFELISEITKGVPRKSRELVRGIGDDCAIFSGNSGNNWLVTTDALIEGVHFKREWTDLKTLGRKSLAVNLSDIAAMGGTPKFYLVSVGLPPGNLENTAKSLFAGMNEVASEHGVTLIGGDTVASPLGIMITITVIGSSPSGKELMRSGAKSGDEIYVTGSFGASALGLCFLKEKILNAKTEPFIKRHNDPVPRVAEGQWAAQSGFATSMIDVSDGLVADLSHIADESGTGFEIESEKIPRDAGFDAAAATLKMDPLQLALSGGEDYELIFTVAKDRAAEFGKIIGGCPNGTRIAKIGNMAGDLKLRRVFGKLGNEIKLDTNGYDHFK